MRMHPCDTRPGRIPRLVRSVHADEASTGPVRQHRRARARAERDRAVDRIGEARHLVADVELAARRRPHRLADADDRLEHDAAVALQRRREMCPVDVEMRVHRVQVAEVARLHPAGRVVRQDRQPHSVPRVPRADVDSARARERCSACRPWSTCRASSPRGTMPSAERGRRPASATAAQCATLSSASEYERGYLRLGCGDVDRIRQGRRHAVDARRRDELNRVVPRPFRMPRERAAGGAAVGGGKHRAAGKPVHRADVHDSARNGRHGGQRRS